MFPPTTSEPAAVVIDVETSNYRVEHISVAHHYLCDIVSHVAMEGQYFWALMQYKYVISPASEIVMDKRWS